MPSDEQDTAIGDEVSSWARFEKVLERGSTSKFFAARIGRDLFSNWSILVEKGRIGQSCRTVTRIFDSEEDVYDDFIDLAKERFIHGYTLVKYKLSQPLENRLLEHEAKLGRPIRGAQTVDAALFAGFHRLLETLPVSADAEDVRPFLRSLVIALDPQRKIVSDCGEFNQFEFREAEEERFPDYRRRVLAFLTDQLLADDPWGRSAVNKALAIPKQIDGNVVSFINKNAVKRTPNHSIGIADLFEAHTELWRLSDVLLDDNISVVSDLLEISREELRVRFGCSAKELQSLDVVLGHRRLNIGMFAA